jgi:hypothetical protein
MQGRLSAPGQSHTIGLPIMSQPIVKLTQNPFHRDIFPSLKRFVRGLPHLAIGAVIGTDLQRHKIDTKRTAQSP